MTTFLSQERGSGLGDIITSLCRSGRGDQLGGVEEEWRRNGEEWRSVGIWLRTKTREGKTGEFNQPTLRRNV